MRKGRAARTPEKPADADSGAAFVRKFAIELFDRGEGEAANWPLIAETLFKAAFEALSRRTAQAAWRSCGASARGLMSVWRLILLQVKSRRWRAGMRAQRRI
jgi:hypothetical protein